MKPSTPFFELDDRWGFRRPHLCFDAFLLPEQPDGVGDVFDPPRGTLPTHHAGATKWQEINIKVNKRHTTFET